MTARSAKGSQGFSMIEVLVSVLVVAVGLVGVSKMQAAGVSNSQIARSRSLIALQASSLAAAMRGNPAYWADTPSPTVQMTGATITDSTGALVTTTQCLTAKCSPSQLASSDLKDWRDQMNQRFPTYSADISCSVAAGMPTRCLISITWEEKYVSINRGSASAAGTSAQQKFTLVVEP